MVDFQCASKKTLPALGDNRHFMDPIFGNSICNIVRKKSILGLALFLLGNSAGLGVCEDVKPPAVAGQLLKTMFSPVIAAEPKPMAVLQRTSLLDQVTRCKTLQIALVVDGTESMAPQLESIQKQLRGMVRDLTAVLKDQLTIQLVVYRDLGAPQPIEFPLGQIGNAFTSDSDAIDRGLEKLLPQSGAPYFLEPVDIGLHTAITKLQWSSDASVSRWILLIGDAPPFDEGFQDDSGAERKHTDEQLILLAKDKGITIHTLICPTRSEDQAIYEEVLEKTKDFFGKLAENTGGTCFDLSDKKFQSEIQSAAKRASVEYVPIAPISLDDIEKMAGTVPKLSEAKTNRPLRIAVLPFMPKQAESLEKGLPLLNPAKNETVLLARQISDQLDQIGAQAIATSRISKEVGSALHRDLRRELLAKSVGNKLGADYVLCVYKSAAANSKFQYDYALLETVGGSYVVNPVAVDSMVRKDSEVSDALLKKIALSAKTLAPPSDLRSLMTKLTPAPPRIRNVSLAETKEVEDFIAKARLALDGVVDFELITSGDPAAHHIEVALTEAESYIRSALAAEKDNPIACLIAANIRIARIVLSPQSVECPVWKKEAISFLSNAKRNANKDVLSESLEIDADSAMLSAKYGVAAEKYSAILKSSESDATKLRARWMLMGLHSGDWEANRFAKELLDPAKARHYALEILAFHPDSPHARRLKQVLQLSSHSPESASPNLPISNKVSFADISSIAP
jgi:hypothetical protein